MEDKRKRKTVKVSVYPVTQNRQFCQILLLLMLPSTSNRVLLIAKGSAKKGFF